MLHDINITFHNQNISIKNIRDAIKKNNIYCMYSIIYQYYFQYTYIMYKSIYRLHIYDLFSVSYSTQIPEHKYYTYTSAVFLQHKGLPSS